MFLDAGEVGAAEPVGLGEFDYRTIEENDQSLKFSQKPRTSNSPASGSFKCVVLSNDGDLCI